MGRLLKQSERSFTLIELLIVIAIIAIIAGAILVAINPARRIAEANDSQRWSEVRSILTATNTFTVDNKGNAPYCTNLSEELPANNRWYVIGIAGGADYIGDHGVGAWLLDEINAGQTPDASVNSNDGTLQNDVSYTQSSYSGGAFEFDGKLDDEDFVNVDHNVNLSPANLTISFWMKVYSQNAIGTPPPYGHQLIIQKNEDNDSDGYFVQLQETDDVAYSSKINFGLNSGGSSESVYTNTAIQDNTWYHIVGTFDGSISRIYVNSILEDTNNSATYSASGDPLYIGIEDGLTFPIASFDGIIDEAAILNTALSADQVREIYYYGLAGEFCNLTDDLVTNGGYLSSLPQDPTEGDGNISGYLIKRSFLGNITVKAPFASDYSESEIIASQ